MRVRQSNRCNKSIIVSLLLPVNLVHEGFLILSLSLAESKSHSWRLPFVERLRLATADCSAHVSIVRPFRWFLAAYRLLQELAAEW